MGLFFPRKNVRSFVDPPSRNPAPSEQKELKSKEGLWFWFNEKLVCCSTVSEAISSFFSIQGCHEPPKKSLTGLTCPNFTDDDATISQTRLGKTVKGPLKQKSSVRRLGTLSLSLVFTITFRTHGANPFSKHPEPPSAAKDANFPIKVWK